MCKTRTDILKEFSSVQNGTSSAKGRPVCALYCLSEYPYMLFCLDRQQLTAN